jgi:hypothetical protein
MSLTAGCELSDVIVTSPDVLRFYLTCIFGMCLKENIDRMKIYTELIFGVREV